MIYTIAEVAELVNLSKASIYTRLKTKDLKPHITKKQGVTYLDEIGFKLIQESLKDFIKDDRNDFKDDINVLNDNSLNDEVATDSEYINYLKEDINYLKEQMSEKDLQINNMNERLKEAHDVIKNNQVLQLRQPQDIKALEEHFTELDTKLLDIKEKMQERKQDQKPKGFFKKIFNK